MTEERTTAAASAPAAPNSDRDANFEREVLSCLPDLSRFARSLTHDAADADDLVQESCLLAYRGYHTFRQGEDPRRWLFRICRNSFSRRRSRERRFTSLDDAGDPAAESLAAAYGHLAAVQRGEGDLLDRIDVGPAITRALGELPDSYRVAVVLVDMEELSYEEAAVVAGVPIGTIRSRLFRARRLLQDKLFAHARDAGIYPSSWVVRKTADSQ
ncbi:MAG: sigma-70 family RNA polymerase sigma factor [Gemmatimonadaceae bacterium]|nr:sigma-70 family RNA polymerase sigma factor [Gemmatimonadaceae bacterium]